MAKIILTDDASLMLDMLGEIVTKLGHSVVGAESGQELLDMYDDVEPDIVFLDLIMEVSGLEVLDELMSRHPEAKVVICSAVGGIEKIQKQVKEKGAIACIKKPVSVEEIKQAIELCLN